MKHPRPAYELFCQAIADGETACRSWILHVSQKCTVASAMVQGCRLLKDVKIALRIQELREKASDILEHRIGVTKEAAMRILWEIVETRPDDLNRLNRLCERWEQTEYGARCHAPSKIDAINLLAELAGWKLATKAQLEIGGSVELLSRGVLATLPQEPGLPKCE